MRVTAAPAARAMLAELTLLHPDRKTASDGILSSNAHKKQNPTSRHDHGNAVDATHDPKHGVDMGEITEEIRQRCAAGIEPRCDEIIYNRRICTALRGWLWRPYTGSNPHDKHAHFSLRHAWRDDTRPWFPPSQPTREFVMDAEAKAALAELRRRVDHTNSELRTIKQLIADLSTKVDNHHPSK